MRYHGIRRVLCICGKEAYYSHSAADVALNRIRTKSFINTDRRECRIYQCDRQPSTWHLTSMSLSDYQAKELDRKALSEKLKVREWVRREKQRNCSRKFALMVLRNLGVQAKTTWIVDPSTWTYKPRVNGPYAGKARAKRRINPETGEYYLFVRVKLKGKR